ncbi:MAG TPA: hypothetical protein VFX59_14635 [Polyangiales bacterium]|nr:hypothetical protein [Polyangiales bacterium]
MKNLIIAAAGLTSLLGCAHTQTSSQAQLATAQCGELSAAEREFARNEALPRVERVEPYKLNDMRTRATQQLTYTAGARLYVPAQQGWNAPYLERVLSCHSAANQSGSANDPFQVAGVANVNVDAHGSRYVITIAGASREAGRNIWQRAETLRDQNSRVDVRQISGNAVKPAM